MIETIMKDTMCKYKGVDFTNLFQVVTIAFYFIYVSFQETNARKATHVLRHVYRKFCNIMKLLQTLVLLNSNK